MKFFNLFIVIFASTLLFSNDKSKADDFISKEISFTNGETSLSGTLTVPDTNKIYPAVILVTGSGQQNRDEEIFGFKLFKIIADSLTKQGIAVLRYDDRGIGQSKGDFKTATTYDFAQDALAGINQLAKFEFIDKNNIGILGHSEGGAIAEIIAAEHPETIRFIVLMSGPCISGADVILSQIKIINQASGKSEKEVEEAIASQKGLYKLMKENKSEAEIKSYLKEITIKAVEQLPEDKKKYITDIDKYATMQAEVASKQVNTPWFKYFINYEPAKDLAKIKCRIIALFGEKDTQVVPEMNSKELENVMSEAHNNNYIIKIFPMANHLYQSAETGLVSEYSNLKKEFVPGFTDFIINQIKLSVK